MKETSCHILKMAIFSKFFGDLMTYVIREYADKKKSECFIIKNYGYSFSLFKVSSLYCHLSATIKEKEVEKAMPF